MGIEKTREERTALKVDQLCLRAPQPEDLLGLPHRLDVPTANRHRIPGASQEKEAVV